MNDQIVSEFEKLIKQIKFDIDNDSKNKKKHLFRLNAIQKALEVIKKFKKKITSSQQLKGYTGIGEGTLKRIDEILKTGILSEIRKNQDEYLNCIEELEKIHGIGYVKAKELYEKYNICSIDELKAKADQLDLPDNILLGIKYHGIVTDAIPRKEITKAYGVLLNIALEIDPEIKITICGSYRREKSFSGDIDVIVVHPDVTKKNIGDSDIFTLLIQYLEKIKFIVDSLTSDNVKTKYMGYCKLSNDIIARIDIRFVPYESYYPAVLYFTGSKDFNKKMRQHALSMDYKLSEYGLFDENGKEFEITSEKDIFDILGFEYVEPKER